jgi:hypothetical protein
MSDREILTMGNRANGVPRPAATAPAQTACTGETLAVVEVQRHGSARAADELPVHTVRAGGQHHAVVMRNNNSRGNSGAMLTPDHEPIRALTTAGHQSLVLPYHRTAEAQPAGTDPRSRAAADADRDRVARRRLDRRRHRRVPVPDVRAARDRRRDGPRPARRRAPLHRHRQ